MGLRRLLPAAALALCTGAAPAQDAVQRYVEAALQSNLALQAQDLAVEGSLQALQLARSAWYPRLDLEARYTRAEGGREVELPIGDYLDPVYRTLNELTAGTPGATPFAPVENPRFSFLREREQDTRLALRAPLYAPALSAEVQARSAQWQAQHQRREALARLLVRDVQQACYALGRAQAQRDALRASEAALAENVRIYQVGIELGRATREQLLRAQAERLALQQRVLESADTVEQARRYLNFLLNRAPGSPLEPVGDIEPAAEAESLPADAAALRRPELRELDRSVDAAQAQADAARALRLPSLSLDAAYGLQGEDYRADAEDDFASVSLLLSWNLLDFGERRARIAQAQAESERLRLQRSSLQRELELAQLQARDALRTQRQSLLTAQARLLAAEEAFRIALRRREAGSLPQIEFLDAESAYTGARLARSAAGYGYAAAQADWQLASASYPLPAALLAPARVSHGGIESP